MKLKSLTVLSLALLAAVLGTTPGFAASDAPPAHYDWRAVLGALTPIKNQHRCGSVWAFAATAAMETAIQIKEGFPVSLSEQHLLSCNEQGSSCNGGWVPYDMAVNPGFVLESDYPYTATKGTCQKEAPIFRQATGYGYVAKDAATGHPSNDAIKRAILRYGAVISTMNANRLGNYSGGVFAQCTGGVANHVVNLIGWDDAGGYWIARNSWGIGWGENGYFRIKYGCSGIGEEVSYLTYEPANHAG